MKKQLAVHSTDFQTFFDNLKELLPKFEAVHHPYNGKPFSDFWEVTADNKTVTVYFGVGGYYLQDAAAVFVRLLND